MPDVNIDLGESYDSPPLAEAPTNKSPVMYPSFVVNSDEELDLPDEGTMTIQYCIRREESSRRSDGTERYSCTIDVEKIVSVDGGPDEDAAGGKDYGKDTTSALDALMKAVKKG